MSKGKRNEREAAEIYEAAGFDTFRPQESKFGETDMFGLFDILAIKPDSHTETRFVQVKTNRPEGVEAWVEEAYPYAGLGRLVEMVVAYDGHGGPHPVPKRWRLIQPEPMGDAVEPEDRVDERNDTVPAEGEGVAEYLEDQ